MKDIEALSEDAMNFLLYYFGLLPDGNQGAEPQEIKKREVDYNKKYRELKKKFNNIDFNLDELTTDFEGEIYPDMKFRIYVIARAAIEVCLRWLSPRAEVISEDTDLTWDLSNLDVVNRNFKKAGDAPPVADIYEVDTSGGGVTVSLPKRDNFPDRTITLINESGGNDLLITDNGGVTVATLSKQNATITLYPGQNRWISIH